MNSTGDRLAVFLHSGDYDRMHQGLSIAAAAAASGRRVDVYLFWWALERLLSDKLDEPDFAREEIADRMEARGVPTLRALIAHLKESGNCTFAACTASLGLFADAEAASKKVDRLVGWTTILKETAGVTDRFYL